MKADEPDEENQNSTTHPTKTEERKSGVSVPVGSSGEKMHLLSGVIILTLGLDDLLLFLLS